MQLVYEGAPKVLGNALRLKHYTNFFSLMLTQLSVDAV